MTISLPSPQELFNYALHANVTNNNDSGHRKVASGCQNGVVEKVRTGLKYAVRKKVVKTDVVVRRVPPMIATQGDVCQGYLFCLHNQNRLHLS